MEFLTALWLPILVAAVLVFVASSIIHMALPIHAGDFRKLPGEEKVLDGLRAAGLERGQYMFPLAGSMKDMGSPEMLEKYKRGPVGWMVILPNGPPAICTSLWQWFLFSIVIGAFAGYAAWEGLGRGAAGAAVFRIAAAVAFAGYGATHAVDSIWKGMGWARTLKHVLDGLVYALLTAAAFAWLWPGAAA